ncbi:hypothetical protein AYI69_g2006 [Smittium culicis]|uniref:Uncharacterized protein n=1 Tax=Smittium culicis TaxID=133412 RepID=A0A1R1YNR3_9FUNG|nr:hypothetical protein AYI69_g2006 [Smittium culicis]
MKMIKYLRLTSFSDKSTLTQSHCQPQVSLITFIQLHRGSLYRQINQLSLNPTVNLKYRSLRSFSYTEDRYTARYADS